MDTVSTYLSHESKESLQVRARRSRGRGRRPALTVFARRQRASAGSLLNCSAGSDDAFEAPAAPPADDSADGGADAAAVRRWVRAAPCPQWGALCPACLRALEGGAGAAPAVALRGCQHMLHLHCLNDRLERLRREGVSAAVLRPVVRSSRCDDRDPVRVRQEAPYIECLVCGRAYGRAEPRGEQPAGSMAWRLQHAPLPGLAPAKTILVTYK